MEKEELKYLTDKITDTETKIDNEFFDLTMEQGASLDFPEAYIKEWIIERIRVLYYLYICYFESRGLSVFLKRFTDTFDKIVNDDVEIYRSEFPNPDDPYPTLKILRLFQVFTEPFMDFNKKKLDVADKEKVINILDSTHFILENAKVELSKEEDIKQALIWVLGLYFHSTRGGKGAFINQFTVYKPDILIKELKIAIEIKYVRSGHNVERFIDEVRSDVNNYVEDLRYNVFIALIVIQNASAATKASIRTCWNEKQFPENWELVVAGEGSLLKK